MTVISTVSTLPHRANNNAIFIITIWVWLEFRLFRSVRRQHQLRLGFAGSNLHITREQRGAFFEANRCVMALSPSLLRLAAAGQKTWLISPFLCLIGERRHLQAGYSPKLPLYRTLISISLCIGISFDRLLQNSHYNQPRSLSQHYLTRVQCSMAL